MLEFDKNGDHLASFDAQAGGLTIVGHDATFLSRDVYRKYMWFIEFVTMS